MNIAQAIACIDVNIVCVIVASSLMIEWTGLKVECVCPIAASFQSSG